VADRGHRLRLGEDLGIGADADLEIGRPLALGDEDTLELLGLRRAGRDLRQVGADRRGHLLADRVGGGGIAARLLLDHALDHALREGDAGGLERLQVGGREQIGLRRIADRLV
jgi:hypothetical protein